MNSLFRVPKQVRIVFSRIGSLLLLFQKTPLVQMLLPEARVLGTSGFSEVIKWSVATVAGLGAFDTVAGATVISQVAPSPNSTSVPATAGTNLSFVVQVTGAPSSKAGSWQVVGSLPPGLTHANAVNSATDSITGIPTTAGSYPITLKAWEDSGYRGGAKSQNFTINVTGGTTATAPAITGQPASTTIGSGTTTTLNVTASGTSPTFQWYVGSSGVTTSPVSGATSASFTTPALSATTSYWAKASNSAGSANSNTAIVTVIPAPAITTQPVSTTINSGGTATLSVAASGPSPSFQWYRGNTGVTTNPVSGATSATFTTPALTATTSYWARATNTAGFGNSNAATVTVITAPSITGQPASVTIENGATTTLTVTASGTSPTFQWYRGSQGVTTNPVAGATSASFTTPALTVTTNYWVRATNAAGNADSNAARVTVNGIGLPAFTTQPVSTTVHSGGTTTLTVAASGSPSIQWYVGDPGVTTHPVPGATLVSYTTPALTTTTSYWARATNVAGSTDSNAATVTVITPPAITGQPASTTIDSGDTATLTVAASGTSPSFQWYFGNSGVTTSPIFGATSASFTTPALTATTSYWARATNAAGQVDSNTAVITVNPPESAGAGPFDVGQVVSVDLNSLKSAGETLKLVGKLPKGLKLNAKTGIITGTVTALPGTYPIQLQVLQGKTVFRTIDYPIVILRSLATFTGRYEALLENSNSTPSGALKIAFKKGNAWSATLETPGAKARKAAGKLSVTGGTANATLSATFAASGAAPAIALTVALDGTSPMISGTYNGGKVSGFRLAEGDELPVTSTLCNLVFEAGVHDGMTVPAGIGWAKGSINNLGTGTFSGLLGDGTPAKFILHLSATGQAVLWSQPYANFSSYIGGIVTLPDLGQSAASNPPLAGEVSWYKSADVKSRSYPAGFPPLEVSVGSSKWIVPATPSALGASLGWKDNTTASVVIDGAQLTNAEPQANLSKLPPEFTLSEAFALVAPSGPSQVPWVGKLTPASGTFSGTFTLPGGFAPGVAAGSAAASGVLLQSDEWGTVTGCGLIKVPVEGIKGGFRTAAMIFNQ